MLLCGATGARPSSLGEFPCFCCDLVVRLFCWFRYRDMSEHVKERHGTNLRLNCKIAGDHGVCSWSCSSYMYCMTRHLADYHHLENTGRGEFPKSQVFLTTTKDPLPKGVS